MNERVYPRRTSVILSFLILAVGAPSGALAQELKAPTLSEAIEYAWAHQARVAIAEEGVRAAEAQVTGARALFLPSLAVNGSYTYSGKLPKQVFDFGEGRFPFSNDDGSGDAPADGEPIEIEFGTRDDYRVIGELQQTLFSWGRVRSGYRHVKKNVEAAQHQVEYARQQTALDVTEAFYGVILAERVVDVAARAQAQADRRLSTVQSRLDVGAATRLDLLQAQVAVANAGMQLIRAHNGIGLTQQNLVRALGMAGAVSLAVTGELEATSFEGDLDDLIHTAVGKRSDRRELLARQSAAESLVKVARAGNKPSASLSGTAMWNDTERQDPQTTWSVRVGVHLPVFDGLATRAQVHQAEALRRQGSLGIEALDSAIVVQVQQAYLSYQEARAVLAAQEEAVTQVDEALRIANLSFENGVITSVELADAELARTQTQLGYVQALHAGAVALARLEQAVGTPLR